MLKMNNMGILMQAVKNPQAFMQQAMQNSQLMQNPIMQNTIEMMQRGDSAGLEETARNLCRERGIDPNEALKKIKQQFGM